MQWKINVSNSNSNKMQKEEHSLKGDIVEWERFIAGKKPKSGNWTCVGNVSLTVLNLANMILAKCIIDKNFKSGKTECKSFLNNSRVNFCVLCFVFQCFIVSLLIMHLNYF